MKKPVAPRFEPVDGAHCADLTKVPRVRAVADYLIEVFQRERRLLAG